MLVHDALQLDSMHRLVLEHDERMRDIRQITQYRL
jgi:hypothetical protein